MSYIMVMGRTLFIYWVISQKTFKFKNWICNNNFVVNMLNVVCYTLIDLIPIGTILFLHWKNYRYEAQKEYALGKSVTAVGTAVKNALTGNKDFSIKISNGGST